MSPRRATAAVACALCCITAAAPGPAHAQDPGTAVGGSVPSYLSLGFDVPSPLPAFPSRRGVWQATITATITASDDGAQLSAADGDAQSAPRLGHLVAGGRVLPDPLEVAAGTGAYSPLDQPFGPLLMQFSDALAARRTPIRLRQRLRAATALPFTKTLLITASTQTP